ncbi:hypothetical protein A3Q56_03248 [Intoshia linei]|uniref:C2H2-type domain-containing protein n=1 Tax=Intoshia linei TaxID=1819745 RepID=A0A177B3Q8_9BILA|nr:hypothetical protein A3Q56_03248 [Intoshia linei]
MQYKPTYLSHLDADYFDQPQKIKKHNCSKDSAFKSISPFGTESSLSSDNSTKIIPVIKKKTFTDFSIMKILKHSERCQNTTISHKINTKTISNKMELCCHICTKMFKSRATLRNHMPVHTGLRAFKCIICDKSFKQASTLSRHKIIHTELKPYNCKQCSSSFNRKSTLYMHMKIHTGIKDITCTFCGKEFNQRGNFHSHYLTHVGNRKFLCSFCGKNFLTKHSLKYHQTRHCKNTK